MGPLSDSFFRPRFRSTILIAALGWAALLPPREGAAQHMPKTVQASLSGGESFRFDLVPSAEMPEEAVRSDFPATPPLSISDALESLYTILRALPEADAHADVQAGPGLDRSLNSVLQYVRNVDSAYPTLPYYQWHSIGRTKVKRYQVEQDSITPAKPIAHVSAIGFTVRRGDVLFKQIRVYGTDGTRFDFDIEKTILSALPRREICMLATEIELERVEMSYRQISREGRKNPRVTVEAGISALPEHGKKSIYNLLLTRQAIDRKRYPEARAYLSEAIRSLAAYKRSRNL